MTRSVLTRKWIQRLATFFLFHLVLGSTAHSNLLYSPNGDFRRGESWYFTLGLGYALPSYPSAVSPAIDSLKSQGAGHTPITVEAGAYWPVMDMTLMGVALSGLFDSYSVNDLKLGFCQWSLAGSLLYTVGRTPGQGILLRGDLGLTRISTSVTGNVGATDASDIGLSVAGGFGYGMPISLDTRVSFMLIYTARLVDGGTFGSPAFQVGMIF